MSVLPRVCCGVVVGCRAPGNLPCASGAAGSLHPPSPNQAVQLQGCFHETEIKTWRAAVLLQRNNIALCFEVLQRFVGLQGAECEMLGRKGKPAAPVCQPPAVRGAFSAVSPPWERKKSGKGAGSTALVQATN